MINHFITNFSFVHFTNNPWTNELFIKLKLKLTILKLTISILNVIYLHLKTKWILTEATNIFERWFETEYPTLKRYFIQWTTRYLSNDCYAKHKLTNSWILLSFKILIYFRVGIIFAFFRLSRGGDWKRALHARGVINNKRAQQSPFSSI